MKLNGHYYFSKKQLETMLKGRDVLFVRGGQELVAGLKLKNKVKQAFIIKSKINKLQKRLASLEVK